MKQPVLSRQPRLQQFAFGTLLAVISACNPQPAPKAASAGELELGAPPAETESDVPATAAAASDPPQKIWAPKAAMCLEGGDQCPAAAGSAQPSAQAPLAALDKLDAQKQYAVPVNTDDPTQGPASARVRVVVFSDFQCPFCRHLDQTLANIKEAYGDRIQLVWKDLPLGNHRFARPAALLAREAFTRRGNAAFWEVHNTLYAEQPMLSETVLESIAQRFGLSWPPDERYGNTLKRSESEAQQLQVPATPTTFVNGYPVIGAKRFAAFKELIDRELAATAPPAH